MICRWIRVASESGKSGWPTGSAYCASKFGVLGLTEAVAAEVMHENINVYAICPGGAITDMFDHEIDAYGKPDDCTNFMQPQDIADVVLFLASEESRALYGVSLDALGRA